MAGLTLQNSRSTARWRDQDDYRLFETIYESVVVLGSVAIWAFGGLAFSLVGLSRIFLSRHRSVQIGRSLLRKTFRFFLRYLEASGLVSMQFDDLDRLARMSDEPGAKPLIIAPNHPSLLDAVFIMAYVPNVACIMKASLMRNPFLRGGAQLAGFIRNDSPRDLVQQSVRALERGSNLLIFPEGTRTSSSAEGVEPFKGGVAIIASLTGLPVQPIFIHSNSNYLSKGWPIHRLPRFPLRYSVTLGSALTLREGEKVRDFLQRIQEVYADRLKNSGR